MMESVVNGRAQIKSWAPPRNLAQEEEKDSNTIVSALK
jgi:hypothetical protein